jgi:DNA-binding MarR family transcriptional regulator
MSELPPDRDMFRVMARDCVAFRVRRASRIVTRAYDRVLADVGLSATQLTLLSAVANRPDLRMAELADVLGFEASSLSRAMALLVKKKWVRAVDGADKRERLFEITEKGREVARLAYTRWLEAQHKLKKVLGADELGALAKSLDALQQLPV